MRQKEDRRNHQRLAGQKLGGEGPTDVLLGKSADITELGVRQSCRSKTFQ